MSEAVFIISPKTAHRAALMPRLSRLLSGVDGISVVGQGATNVKVRARRGLDLHQHLSREVLDHCHIEPARRYLLAAR